MDIVQRIEHYILHKSVICIRMGLKRINVALLPDYPGSEKGIVATAGSHVNEYITRRKSVFNVKRYFFFVIPGLSKLFVKAQVHIREDPSSIILKSWNCTIPPLRLISFLR